MTTVSHLFKTQLITESDVPWFKDPNSVTTIVGLTDSRNLTSLNSHTAYYYNFATYRILGKGMLDMTGYKNVTRKFLREYF